MAEAWTEAKRQAQSQTQAHNPAWRPQAGPQAAAYDSPADVLGYGGEAGGGKTDLLLGLAGTRHHRSIIFRRTFPEVRAIIERSREIFNAVGASHSDDSYNEQLHIWRLHQPDRMIEFGSMQFEKDRLHYQGRPFDFYGIDEAPQFTEAQIRFATGWNRSTRKGQRCRVVLTFNPPMDETGDWIVEFFKPWLAWLHPDSIQHPNPAAPGTLRWYAMIDGKEIETADGSPFEHKGEAVVPKSRSFIPASLKDNPILAATGYGATIDAMPEPYRSILHGDFGVRRANDPWQLIPGEWVRLAQARWTPECVQPLDAIGCDVARGGKDDLVIAPRHGVWFAPLLKYPGVSVNDGPKGAALVMAALGSSGAYVNVDVGGVGSSVFDSLHYNIARVMGINFGGGSDATDKSGRLRFVNLRAEMYWHMREALDPVTGDGLALPPDDELRADLCAPRWKLTPRGVLIESKEDIIARIGRSPDCGDAVVLANHLGNAGPLVAFEIE